MRSFVARYNSSEIDDRLRLSYRSTTEDRAMLGTRLLCTECPIGDLNASIPPARTCPCWCTATMPPFRATDCHHAATQHARSRTHIDATTHSLRAKPHERRTRTDALPSTITPTARPHPRAVTQPTPRAGASPHAARGAPTRCKLPRTRCKWPGTRCIPPPTLGVGTGTPFPFSRS